MVVFSCRTFNNILKYWYHLWLFQTIIEEFSKYIRSSGPQLFRNTTGVHSGPDAFEKSRFIMIFLTIIGVTETLGSFRLVLERKTGKEIPESSTLEFLQKFSVNNFALSDTENNTSRPLNKGGIADLPLLRTILAIHQKSREPSFWEVMDSLVLLAYANLAASRSLLQWLLACLNLLQIQRTYPFGTHERSDFYELWQQCKQRKPWRWERLDLVLLMRIYINSNLNPITKFTSSSRSTEFKDILPWNISKMITKTITISLRIVLSNLMKRGIPLSIWWKVNRNWDNNMIRNSQWRERHCRTYTSVRRKK